MTPIDPRLISRVLTVVAATLLVAGVIAMHSLMVGHSSMPLNASISAVAPQHAMTMSGHAVTGQAITGHAVTGQAITGHAVTGHAVTGNAMNTPIASVPTTAHEMTAMCLAVLPALALLLTLALLRLRSRQGILPPQRLAPRQRAPIWASPLRRTAPSLAQLCVLRA